MSLRVVTAGESHGPCLTAVIEGLPAGIPVDEGFIRADLARRQLKTGAGGRMAIETDEARILAGVMEGRTTGAPVALQIVNADFAKWRGRAVPAYTTPRPGHADLAALAKYGYSDIRPALERASARETASRVAAGAVFRAFLAEFGIHVGGFVSSIGGVQSPVAGETVSEGVIRQARTFATQMPDAASDALARQAIEQAKADGETLGGVIEIAAFGVPPGLGSFATPERRLDARLGSAVLGVQAVKGVEIGDAFANSARRGTEAHDPIRLSGDALVRASNRCGGIEGGISNGETVWLRAAMKPIPTTLKPQPTVNLATGKEGETRYERSDFCPVPRAVVVLEAVVAHVLADALTEKLGGDSLDEMKPRFAALRRLSLPECGLKGTPDTHLFWNERQ